MSTFDNGIGPECHISIRGDSKEHIAELRTLLLNADGGKDTDTLPDWFGNALMPDVFSALQLFLLTKNVAKHPIAIESEFSPWMHESDHGVMIGISINVLHDADDSEALEDFFYSGESDSFLIKEIAGQVYGLLKPKAAWMSVDYVSVAIEGVGQG